MATRVTREMQSLYGVRSVAQSLGIDSRDVLSRMGGPTGQKLIAAMGPRHGDWFRFANAANSDTTELYIYDEIGWFGTTAAEFAEQLRDIESDRIDVHLNSVGGSVFDGIAIYNGLRSHPAYVTTQVDSAALSIASVIAQAGDKRVMMSGSQMMIHDAWGLAIGDASAMREYADLLDRQTANIAAIYAEHSGADVEHFLALMAGEQWLTPDEALDEGLTDEVVSPQKQSDPGLEDVKDAAPAADRWTGFVAAADGIPT